MKTAGPGPRRRGGERGVALPMALIALMVLSALTVAFALLAQTEPVIANNHQRAAVARAMAESGLERAVWALTQGSGVSGGVTVSPGAVASAPYDGANFLTVTSGLGGFTVKLTGVTSGQVSVEAVGWMPDNGSSGNAHKKISATLIEFPDFGKDAPCALCVNGNLTVTGNSSVDARPSAGSACGNKVGTMSTGSLTIQGRAADIYGADGNSTPNEATDYSQNQPSSVFNDIRLSDDEMDLLKAYARANGTYYQGTVEFDSSNPISKNGIVFIDTVSGNNIVPGTTPDSDLASVELHGGAIASPPFTGWIIVNGNLDLSGNFGEILGTVYVAGQAATTGFGSSTLKGLLIVEQKLGGAGFSAGNTRIEYSCNGAGGGGQVPGGWVLKLGSYREVEGS